MTQYRAVVRHVRYWRGEPQVWSTVYPMNGVLSGVSASAFCETFLATDDAMCFTAPNSNGGTFECDLYNQATGGVPIGSYQKFDHTATGSWIGYGGGAWGGLTGSFEDNAEVALQVEWPAGLSSSGKPVKLRKWYHAVLAENPAGGAAQVPAAAITSLKAGAVAIQSLIADAGMVLQSPSGRLAGTPVVLPYYGNHQMPKGRKRKVITVSSGSGSSGILSIVAGLLDAGAE